jgi:CDGSH-type Zn-finger protein
MDSANDKKPLTIIEVTDGGPLEIKGHIILKDLKRDSEVTLGDVSLCLCGRSGNKPYCDCSHKK